MKIQLKLLFPVLLILIINSTSAFSGEVSYSKKGDLPSLKVKAEVMNSFINELFDTVVKFSANNK